MAQTASDSEIGVRVEYFAVLREHVGRAHEDLRTTAATVRSLCGARRRYAFPPSAREGAVNDEFRDWSSACATVTSLSSSRSGRGDHFQFSRDPFTP